MCLGKPLAHQAALLGVSHHAASSLPTLILLNGIPSFSTRLVLAHLLGPSLELPETTSDCDIFPLWTLRVLSTCRCLNLLKNCLINPWNWSSGHLLPPLYHTFSSLQASQEMGRTKWDQPKSPGLYVSTKGVVVYIHQKFLLVRGETTCFLGRKGILLAQWTQLLGCVGWQVERPIREAKRRPSGSVQEKVREIPGCKTSYSKSLEKGGCWKESLWGYKFEKKEGRIGKIKIKELE